MFDLGLDLRCERRVPTSPEQTWTLSLRVVESYREQGFVVVFADQEPPSRLSATITNPQGAQVEARVELAAEGDGTLLGMQLVGQVSVTGMEAMFASEDLVRQVARERLEQLLDQLVCDAELELPAQPPPAARVHDPHSLEGRLELVRDLHERGLINAEDFRRKKLELLERLL